VRELRNLVEATIAMGEAPQVEGEPVAAAAGGDPLAGLIELPYKEARGALLADFEKRYLTALLARAKGNVSLAAREARMDRSHLIDLLQRHKLKSP
jgi:DNA-binding NtrC family response regulator